MGDKSPLVAASSSSAEILRSNWFSGVLATSDRTDLVRGTFRSRSLDKKSLAIVKENFLSASGSIGGEDCSPCACIKGALAIASWISFSSSSSQPPLSATAFSVAALSDSEGSE